MDAVDFPVESSSDPTMASAVECMRFQRVAQTLFGEAPQDGLAVRLRRQDYGLLGFGRSAIGSPLKLGQVPYRHGIGTHANSVIEVDLPQGSRAFHAVCGIDNNPSTGGQRGSVVFSLAVDGKELWKSPVRRGSAAGLVVDLPLAANARLLTLSVDSTADGAGYDQADWCEAQIVDSQRRARWLDAGPRPPIVHEDEPPFSFEYGGKDGRALLAGWLRSVWSRPAQAFTEYFCSWLDPLTKLKIEAHAKAYKLYPAVDWVLTFENTGGKDTPLIERIQACEVGLNLGGREIPAMFRGLQGDSNDATSFRPFELAVPAGARRTMAPAEGRSSQATGFPFFDLAAGDQGLVAAIGWSGQWAMSVSRDAEGVGRLVAGMEKTRLVLHPGEKIRTPRILLMSYDGDRTGALNRWRKLILHHYTPRHAGQPALPPIASQCFDRYVRSQPEWATEKGQVREAELAHELGFDALWFDAAWFPGEFPNGVGNWSAKPAAFPRGLKPVSDRCHELGLKYIVWFEPERVGPGTQIAAEHPEWIFGRAGSGLFRLDLPEARRWMTDLLSRRVEEFGLDVYRQDFNMNPLGSWRANDAPDRQGMTEIRYVEGLYEMWDEMVRRRPGLLIDNCASGGRRLDLETMLRAFPLWRSDTGCGPGMSSIAQAQTFGLSRYLPIHATASWSGNAYEMRSAATTGIAVEFDYLSPAFDAQEAKVALDEVKANRGAWLGDFYPLTPCTAAQDEFAAYQFHRPDREAGIVLAFRRDSALTMGIVVAPQGIKPKLTYEVEFIDEARRSRKTIMAGRDLIQRGLELRISKPHASLLVRYKATLRTGRRS